MLPPISNAADAAAIPPVQPGGAQAASEAAAAAPAALTAAATVEFSDLAQFLSTVALTRRQLLELQGIPATPQPSEAQLRLLNDAADALRLSFNQLPPASTDLTPLLTDDDGSSTLAGRLADTLRQQGATGLPGSQLAVRTLADIGLTLDPLAPESTSEILNLNTRVLEAAFQIDREGTLNVLARTSDEFSALGNALVRQVSANTAPEEPLPAALQAETTASQLQLSDQALRNAILESTPALTQAEIVRQQQLEVARQALAERAGSVLGETQAERLAANRAAEDRQLNSTRGQDLAATALADRLENERLAAQRQDATAQAILADRLENERAAAQRQQSDAAIAARQALETRTAQTAAGQRITDQRVADQQAADQQAAEQRVAEQRLSDQQTDEQRVAEQRAADQRIAAQRTAEQHTAEQRIADQRVLADPRSRSNLRPRSGAVSKRYHLRTGNTIVIR